MATNSIAVCFGLNSVDPGKYEGWSGELNACESDAVTMATIAKSTGFASVKTALTAEATRDRVLAEIRSAASELAPGGIFMLSYSGHGGQMPDLNGDESDDLDETWCMYDGQLVDDELYGALTAFQKGVRVLAFADSCHSGTSIKGLMTATFYVMRSDRRSLPSISSSLEDLTASTDVPAFKAMPPALMQTLYFKNKEFYDPILSNKELGGARGRIQASVLFFAACQDSQLSRDGIFNGAFTGHLLSVWNAGRFDGNYRAFARRIRAGMPPDQTPFFSHLGVTDPAFERQAPFTV